MDSNYDRAYLQGWEDRGAVAKWNLTRRGAGVLLAVTALAIFLAGLR